MTDDVFERRTRRFIETPEILERLQRTPWERFSTDPEKYASAERFLQIAVEVLEDLGDHLVAKTGAGPIERCRDIPDRLLAAGRLSEDQADVWRRVGRTNGAPSAGGGVSTPVGSRLRTLAG
jgi:uncharacterized protein YutE (UPF0331/DUF86 family)